MACLYIHTAPQLLLATLSYSQITGEGGRGALAALEEDEAEQKELAEGGGRGELRLGVLRGHEQSEHAEAHASWPELLVGLRREKNSPPFVPRVAAAPPRGPPPPSRPLSLLPSPAAADASCQSRSTHFKAAASVVAGGPYD